MDNLHPPTSHNDHRGAGEDSDIEPTTPPQLDALMNLDPVARSQIDGSLSQALSSRDQSDELCEAPTGTGELAKESSNTDAPVPFPLMDLPTELRLMIFEYSMAHDQDLYWCWKNEVPGERVGHFVSTPRSLFVNYAFPYPPASNKNPVYNIVTRLHISRQLRAETLHLWEKFAILHFDGQDEAPDSRPRRLEIPSTYELDHAIFACKFFTLHSRTLEMSRSPQIVIDALFDLYCQTYYNDLLGLLGHEQHGHDPRFSNSRVVIHDRHLVERLVANNALDGFERHQHCFRWEAERVDADFVGRQRCGKIFPDPSYRRHVEKTLEGAKTREKLEVTMNLIENGA